jgi:hypothetical protein
MTYEQLLKELLCTLTPEQRAQPVVVVIDGEWGDDFYRIAGVGVNVDGARERLVLTTPDGESPLSDLLRDITGEKTYEEASGNTVIDGWVIDQSGRRVVEYSDDMARNYLATVRNNNEDK